MIPEDIGFNPSMKQFMISNHLENFEAGRVFAEHKERYLVQTPMGEVEAEITGNMRYTATSREDYPVVGDWVALNRYNDGKFGIIHAIYPRYSMLKRPYPGKKGAMQAIAANIDFALLMQAADRDFNLNRLERYLAICYSTNVKPIIILTKTDLTDTLRINEIIFRIRQRITNVPVHAISTLNSQGLNEFQSSLIKGQTYCMLGSSGVGKSSLLNHLTGQVTMKTSQLSPKTHKGSHTTTHRELFILDNQVMLIDNPGMREIGIGEDENGLETTFDRITELSANCRYPNCTHTSEPGCSVLEALTMKLLDIETYENYLKLEKERKFLESTLAERRKKDKSFGKMIKVYKKGMNKKI